MRRVRVKDPPTLVLVARNGTHTVVDDVRELFLRFPDGRELELDLAPHPTFSNGITLMTPRARQGIAELARGNSDALQATFLGVNTLWISVLRSKNCDWAVAQARKHRRNARKKKRITRRGT